MTYRAVKRGIDVVVAGVALLLLSPVMAVVAALVYVGLGRPVLFRQQRPGRNGKPFMVAKFRTMRNGLGTDAERLTRLGRLLRSTSLDELPQLWNVVRGEMSLIGPRPLLMEYLPAYSARQARRHEVRPGITGLAQVSGRNAITWEDRLELDVVYVDSVSLRMDAEIVAKTIRSVVQRDGISAEGEATMTPFVETE